jgi:large subunit ribosomal protein L4
VTTIEVRDVAGSVVGERELPGELFEAPVNVPLMHQVVVAGAAAQRAGTHSTKTRGDVRGGGVKPWRQKGTGRARHGSIRSPIWSGGGVAHGPHPHGHEMRVNKKMKKGALRAALSDALASGKLAIVETLAFAEPRTKDAVRVLDALALTGKVLIVLSRPNGATERSFRNLRTVRIDYPGNLSTYDLLYADRVLFTQAALGVLTGEEPDAEETVVELAPLEPPAASQDEPTADARAESDADAGAQSEPTAEPEADATQDDEVSDDDTDGSGDDGASGDEGGAKA